MSRESYTCPDCRLTSYHPMDTLNRYCANCHRFDRGSETWFLRDAKTVLDRVHPKETCRPPCPLHAPSDHHMNRWPLVWCDDGAFFQRLCAHRQGHADPDSANFARRHQGRDISDYGCDGCCCPPPLSPKRTRKAL